MQIKFTLKYHIQASQLENTKTEEKNSRWFRAMTLTNTSGWMSRYKCSGSGSAKTRNLPRSATLGFLAWEPFRCPQRNAVHELQELFKTRTCTYAQWSEFIIFSRKYLILWKTGGKWQMMSWHFLHRYPEKGTRMFSWKNCPWQLLHKWTRSRYENLFVPQTSIVHLYCGSDTVQGVKSLDRHKSLSTWSINCHWQNVRSYILFEPPKTTQIVMGRRTGMEIMVHCSVEYYSVMKTNRPLKRENSYMHKHGWEFQQQKSYTDKSDLIPFTSRFWFHLHQISKSA